MRMTCCALLLLLATVSTAAQTAAAPKYKVIAREKGEKLLAKLTPVADTGYRVIVPGFLLVLRLDAAPPETYRYAVADETIGPLEFVNWLNDQGARGYRWLPDAHVLEKEPHPRNFEYALARHGKRWPAKAGDYSALASQGYHMCGDKYMMRELHAVTPAKQSTVQLAIAEPNEMAIRPGKLIDKVRALAAQGYRYWGPRRGGVLMEKCRDVCHYEYDQIHAHDAAQIERDLNARGSAGFRWLPQVWAPGRYTLERDASSAKTFAYRVLAADDATELERTLNASATDGFEPIGFMSHAGWKVQNFLIVEKVAR